MEDLTVGQVMAVHAGIMVKTERDDRVLSEAGLHQMVFQANLIADCIPRAAFIFFFLCAYPVFREGNTETALSVTEEVLLSEGYRITGNRAGIIDLAEGISAFAIDSEDIEQWLRSNVRKSELL